MSRVLRMRNVIGRIALPVFMLAACHVEKGELKDNTGYTPVKACVEDVISYRVMKKEMVSVRVSYHAGGTAGIDTATVSLGRKSKWLLHKGDSLQFYVHPEHPDELRFNQDELVPVKSPHYGVPKAKKLWPTNVRLRNSALRRMRMR